MASHDKPWAASSPAERLAPYNAFPLEASYDRLFDQSLITFTDTGTLVVSSALDAKDRALLDLHGNLLRHPPPPAISPTSTTTGNTSSFPDSHTPGQA